MATQSAEAGWARDLALIDDCGRSLGRDEECFALLVLGPRDGKASVLLGEKASVLLGEKAPRGCAEAPVHPPDCLVLGMAVLCGHGERIEIEVGARHAKAG